jgi:hypothetical protein
VGSVLVKSLDFLIRVIYIIENNSERELAMGKNCRGFSLQTNVKENRKFGYKT